MKHARILQIVRDRMRTDGGAYYDDSEPPDVEILAETDKHIAFLAHRYVYNFAQSGSDWADHYVVLGTANKASGEIVIEPHHVRLTERESDDYDKAATLDRLRALPRCSQCGSTNIVVWERVFGWMKYACNGCGHKATE